LVSGHLELFCFSPKPTHHTRPSLAAAILQRIVVAAPHQLIALLLTLLEQKLKGGGGKVMNGPALAHFVLI